MNYQKIYDAIITRSKSRKKPNCYTEKHHIMPKSMGGSNEKENIAVLTAREHFLAHWLLFKIHKNKSMTFAFFAMTKPVGNGKTRYTSESYKYARESLARLISETRTGENHPLYGIKGENNPNFGSKRTLEQKQNISKKAKERFLNSANRTRIKKVVCIETGDIFDSISDAKKKFTKGNISYALRFGGTAGGFTFSYFGMEKNNFLKGYCSGANVKNSVKIKDEFENIYECARDAGKSIGVSGTAVLISIKENRPCKNVRFYRA